MADNTDRTTPRFAKPGEFTALPRHHSPPKDEKKELERCMTNWEMTVRDKGEHDFMRRHFEAYKQKRAELLQDSQNIGTWVVILRHAAFPDDYPATEATKVEVAPKEDSEAQVRAKFPNLVFLLRVGRENKPETADPGNGLLSLCWDYPTSQALVPVKLAVMGQEYEWDNFIVDSGASHTILSYDTYRLMLKIFQSTGYGNYQLGTASLQTVLGAAVVFTCEMDLTFAGVLFPRKTIYQAPAVLPFPGLLGADVLMSGTLTLDGGRGSFTFHGDMIGRNVYTTSRYIPTPPAPPVSNPPTASSSANYPLVPTPSASTSFTTTSSTTSLAATPTVPSSAPLSAPSSAPSPARSSLSSSA